MMMVIDLYNFRYVLSALHWLIHETLNNSARWVLLLLLHSTDEESEGQKSYCPKSYNVRGRICTQAAWLQSSEPLNLVASCSLAWRQMREDTSCDTHVMDTTRKQRFIAQNTPLSLPCPQYLTELGHWILLLALCPLGLSTRFLQS